MLYLAGDLCRVVVAPRITRTRRLAGVVVLPSRLGSVGAAGVRLIDEQIDQGVGAHEVRDDTTGRARGLITVCGDAPPPSAPPSGTTYGGRC